MMIKKKIKPVNYFPVKRNTEPTIDTDALKKELDILNHKRIKSSDDYAYIERRKAEINKLIGAK